MNSNLANKLLARTMNWKPKKLASELATLEFMGSMKYDAYDRFMPGMRFMSSLVLWLDSIDEKDRDKAFDFIKKRLIFISSTQMNYLVDLLYDNKIRNILLNTATEEVKMPYYMLANEKVQKQFQIEKRSSLVIGLSDGAHTDILRRSAGFNNEQVLTNYYPDSKKLEDMLDELRNDELFKGRSNVFFRRIFLIDDFTASGKSFIRYEEEDGKYHGKLKKIINELCAENSDCDNCDKGEGFKHLSYLLNPAQNEIKIDILFCIATQKAKNNIETALKAYLDAYPMKRKVDFEVHVVQPIDDQITNAIKSDADLNEVLKNHFVIEAVMSKSYKKGKHDEPWLGFDECALPIVLSHNTPNNSLPILWQDHSSFHGLFPRISRH